MTNTISVNKGLYRTRNVGLFKYIYAFLHFWRRFIIYGCLKPGQKVPIITSIFEGYMKYVAIAKT